MLHSYVTDMAARVTPNTQIPRIHHTYLNSAIKLPPTYYSYSLLPPHLLSGWRFFASAAGSRSMTSHTTSLPTFLTPHCSTMIGRRVFQQETAAVSPTAGAVNRATDKIGADIAAESFQISAIPGAAVYRNRIDMGEQDVKGIITISHAHFCVAC